MPQARRVLGTLNEVAGPHFRFEEESLYPALRPFFSSYVDKLYRDHDGAIETARQLLELVSREQLSEEEAEEGARGPVAAHPCQRLRRSGRHYGAHAGAGHPAHR
ncbi:MAG: hypothetical protein C4289_13260, partial [Chloroflexota bacterium]